jgi:hypothetical protein
MLQCRFTHLVAFCLLTIFTVQSCPCCIRLIVVFGFSAAVCCLLLLTILALSWASVILCRILWHLVAWSYHLCSLLFALAHLSYTTFLCTSDSFFHMQFVMYIHWVHHHCCGAAVHASVNCSHTVFIGYVITVVARQCTQA